MYARSDVRMARPAETAKLAQASGPVCPRIRASPVMILASQGVIRAMTVLPTKRKCSELEVRLINGLRGPR